MDGLVGVLCQVRKGIPEQEQAVLRTQLRRWLQSGLSGVRGQEVCGCHGGHGLDSLDKNQCLCRRILVRDEVQVFLQNSCLSQQGWGTYRRGTILHGSESVCSYLGYAAQGSTFERRGRLVTVVKVHKRMRHGLPDQGSRVPERTVRLRRRPLDRRAALQHPALSWILELLVRVVIL